MHPPLKAFALAVRVWRSPWSAVAQSLAQPANAAAQKPAQPGHAVAQGAAHRLQPARERMEVRPGGTVIGQRPGSPGLAPVRMQQPAGGPMPTVVRSGPGALFTLASPVTSSPAWSELDPNFGMVVSWHDDSAAFRVPTRAARTALPGTYDVQVRVSYQRCNNRICLPLQTDTLRAPLTVAGAPEAGRRPPAR
jgi:hypothetical protein